MWLFGLFWAKMTKIGIQNPKRIVTNDYQQYLAHFEWFISLFQISELVLKGAGGQKAPDFNLLNIIKITK